MQWSVIKGRPQDVDADLLVVTVGQGEAGPDGAGLSSLPAPIRSEIERGFAVGAFRGQAESWLLLPVNGLAAKRVLVVGLGKRDQLSPNALRRCAGVAAEQARSFKAGRCLLWMPGADRGGLGLQTLARCWVEGVELALSTTGELKTDPEKRNEAARWPREWLWLQTDKRRLPVVTEGIAEGQAYAAGCLYARRLVNLPANHLTPSQLAEEAKRLARREGLRCRVLGRVQLSRQRMGGVLAVAQGSSQEPNLILIETPVRKEGPGSDLPLVALVGKGVTFDAGGISLKPAAKMELMKIDMAGAAAVLGAVITITRLQLPVRLLAAIPATENMPDGSALKPSDVITMASGKSVEIVNTDAEGRLILADALHWVCRRRPDYVIDAATLTGACVNALGEYFAGLMSNSAELVDVVGQAGGETFERVWHLPLVEEHSKALESSVADLKNLGPREAGVSTAAAFLAAFVDEAIPWAHLDIAGPVWSDKAGPLGPKGATGFGARLMARAVEILVS
jgi:leucyl aminopeptidase